MSATQLPFHSTTRSHQTTLHASPTASTTEHMSWNRTPALCSTPSTIHVQASVPFLQPQFIQAHYRLDSASHPCRAKPTIATFDPTHSTQTTCSKFAHQMDDPPRTRVRSLLKSAIQCRQLPLPPSPRPLVLPFLCRPTFTSQTRTWLRQFAIHPAQTVAPAPTISCPKVPRHSRQTHHTSTSIVLTLQVDEKKCWHDPPVCPCHQLRAQHPHIQTTTLDNFQHIASPAGLLTVPFRLQQFLATHAGTQVYPTKQHYCQQTWPTPCRWPRHCNLFNVSHDHWVQHIHDQWFQHTAHSRHSISHRDIQYLKSITNSGGPLQGSRRVSHESLYSVHSSTGLFSEKHSETQPYTPSSAFHLHKPPVSSTAGQPTLVA